jgi:hypothetical protein
LRQQNVVTISDTKPVSRKLIMLSCDVVIRGGERTMATINTACYYGLHFGCVNALLNPDCRRCAERLTHVVNAERLTSAVNKVIRPNGNEQRWSALQ